MPRLSVWSVRLALIYLLLGFTLGTLLLINKGLPFASWVWKLLPIHIAFLIFGFIIQLAMGVAFWILPRFPGGRRGPAMPGWTAILMLNLGIWVVSYQAWFGLAGPVLLVGRMLEGLAGLLFVVYIWMRIKSSNYAQMKK